MLFARKEVAQFQQQNCQLTLQQAVNEFYQINSHLFTKPDTSTTWSELLIHHDVGHVVFGINTTLLDESIGDCWTFMATDMSFKEYLAYGKTPEARALVKAIGFFGLLKTIIFGTPFIFKVYWRARKMNHKWKMRDYQQYLDMPLGEVRKKFNIEILTYR